MPYKPQKANAKIGPKPITVTGNFKGCSFNKHIEAVCGNEQVNDVPQVASIWENYENDAVTCEQKPMKAVVSDNEFFNELNKQLNQNDAAAYEQIPMKAKASKVMPMKAPEVVNHPIYGHGVVDGPQPPNYGYYGVDQAVAQAAHQDYDLLAEKLFDAIEFYCNEHNLNFMSSRKKYLAKIREIGMIMGIYKP